MCYYALVKDGVVVNTVIWDGETEVKWEENIIAHKMPDNQVVGIGYLYQEGKFFPVSPTQEEIDAEIKKLIELNIATKDQLIANATQSIVVFQTKLLMGRKLTAAETVLLNGRMDYTDLLTEVDANTSEPIEWPPLPA